MTGMEAFKRALRLLGYTDMEGETDAVSSGELYKRALAIVDQLCGELSLLESGKTETVTSLHAALPLSEKSARHILPYGVAMFLAAGRGDGDSQRLFAALYTQKLTLLSHPGERRVDVLPRGCDV
ncbi:MAG: hypothetical protein IJO59_06115 [Clostridia bacterium]|nr:hypothetical protein [Clostridia bacterium]